MSQAVYPGFVDHLVFRVNELDKTEQFYTVLLGKPAERSDGSVMYQVGETHLFFTRRDQSRASTYDKENVGLNHLAFGVRTGLELESIEEQLNGAGIAHSGIRQDPYGHKDFIWMNDPDGMRLEFYLRPR